MDSRIHFNFDNSLPQFYDRPKWQKFPEFRATAAPLKCLLTVLSQLFA